MALSLIPTRTSPKKKEPVTLQPISLQPTATRTQPTSQRAAATATAATQQAAPASPPPSPPRETVPTAIPGAAPTALSSSARDLTFSGSVGTSVAPQGSASGAYSGFGAGFGANRPGFDTGRLDLGNLEVSQNEASQSTGRQLQDLIAFEQSIAGRGGTNIDVTGPGSRSQDSDGDGIPDVIDNDGATPNWMEEVAAGRDFAGGGTQTQTNEQFDQQVRQLMGDLLAGRGMDVSTAEEEALIKQLMEDRLGQGLVEQRARMGRAGFGASGALAAIEGDVRRQAGQQATQETLATRRQAEQEAIDNALRAVGVDVEKRREGREAIFDQEFLSALQSYLGMGETGGAPTGRPGGPSGPGPSGSQGAPTEDRSNPAPRPTEEGGRTYDLGSKAAVPNNASYSYTEGGYDVYVDEVGNKFRVPAGS